MNTPAEDMKIKLVIDSLTLSANQQHMKKRVVHSLLSQRTTYKRKKLLIRYSLGQKKNNVKKQVAHSLLSANQQPIKKNEVAH